MICKVSVEGCSNLFKILNINDWGRERTWLYSLVAESLVEEGEETWIRAAALVKILFPHWKVPYPISDWYLFTVSMYGLINVCGSKVKKSVEGDLESKNTFLPGIWEPLCSPWVQSTWERVWILNLLFHRWNDYIALYECIQMPIWKHPSGENNNLL